MNEGYTPRGKDFPTLVDYLPFWTSVQRDGLGTFILDRGSGLFCGRVGTNVWPEHGMSMAWH